MEKGLLEKTGKSLDHWIKVVQATKIEKHGEIIKFLKTEHGFTHGFANFVSLKARAADAASFNEKDLIATQYKGKESLKPIYELILSEVKKFGDDVEVATKKTNVSLKTKKQFALVQPSTKTRIDLGLKLKGKEPQGRLENSGPFGAMCTHRIKLSQVSEVDAEVINYLKEAYEQSH
jgi:predicted transport protein